MLPHKKITVLVVDDELSIRESLSGWLRHDGYVVETAADGLEALAKIRENHYDIMLMDVKMPRLDGIAVLKKLQESDADTAVVMMTAYGAIQDAVEAMKLGAYDYLLKPFDLEELSLTMDKLVQMQTLAMENLILKDRVATMARFENLVGQSPLMLQLFETIAEVAPSDANVLITGETGTGKELAARAIHGDSPRCYSPFIAVNCGAFTEHLLESELFGHEKGAFTDAKYLKKGRLEMVNAGTLFLDEAGDLSMKMQIDLLRVLETHEFTRVGGRIPLRSDFRVIAATHQDLQANIRNKTFRQDLFQRLNVRHLQVPPLRERAGRHPLAGPALPAALCHRNRQKARFHPTGGLGSHAAIFLAGERPRAGKRHRTGGHGGKRPPNPAWRPAFCFCRHRHGAGGNSVPGGDGAPLHRPGAGCGKRSHIQHRQAPADQSHHALPQNQKIWPGAVKTAGQAASC